MAERVLRASSGVGSAVDDYWRFHKRLKQVIETCTVSPPVSILDVSDHRAVRRSRAESSTNDRGITLPTLIGHCSASIDRSLGMSTAKFLPLKIQLS